MIAMPGQRLWWRTFGVIALSLYLPFSWIIVVGAWGWLRMWLILPGLIAERLARPNEPVEFCLMGLMTILLLVGLSWLGSRGRGYLLLAMLLALLVSLPSAYGAYGMYRA